MTGMRVSERELEVMKAMWALGREASVGEVHEAMQQAGSDLAFTTVQTMLQRLAAKRQLRRRVAGRTAYYAAVMKEPAAARVALRTLVDHFFGGSTAQLAAHLVEEELSESDVKRIETLLSHREKERR
jgi:BlaI family penicillinase repressor